MLGARLARKSVIPGPLSGPQEFPLRSFQIGMFLVKIMLGA
jgi:hypothetical protein